MKKVLSVLLTLLICLSLFACSSNDTENNEVATSEPEVQEVVEEETNVESSEVVTQEETTVVEEESKEVDVTSLYYWVNFLNKDGSVIQRTAVKYGETPEYKGETPTYQDYSHYYSFREWDKQISPVYMTQTYIALYDVIGDIISSSNNNSSGGNNGSGQSGPSYLTFKSYGKTSVIPQFEDGRNFAFRINNGTWKTDRSITDTTKINLDDGDVIQFKGLNLVTTYEKHFSMCAEETGAYIEASGDVTSLTNEYGGDVDLVSAYQNIGSYTGCYNGMFANCSILKTAPNLPSTTLMSHCYQSMFNGCTSLTIAPALPATTLCSSCYCYMFKGCSSLYTAPHINATILPAGSCNQMYTDCGALKLTTNVTNHTNYGVMFSGYITAESDAIQYMFGKTTSGTRADVSELTNGVEYASETLKFAANRTFYWYTN